MRDAPARVSRGLDPISAMSWGRKPVRRGQQGRTSIRMADVYAVAPDKASDMQIGAMRPRRKAAAGLSQPADLSLGHHARCDVSGADGRRLNPGNFAVVTAAQAKVE
jgi:hypothetical protein